MTTFEDILEEIQEQLEEAWNLPLSGGKCFVDGKKIAERLRDLEVNFPTEIKKARAIVEERDRIINKAKTDAEQIVLSAQKRRDIILNEQDIMREARDRSENMLKNAQEEAALMKKAAVDFIGEHLRRTEAMYEDSLAKIKQARRGVSGDN